MINDPFFLHTHPPTHFPLSSARLDLTLAARNCRYDRGALCSSEDQDEAARHLHDRDMDLSAETSEPRLAAEVAKKAKRVAIETSRLVMGIENDLIKSALVNGHTSASSSQPFQERLPVMI